MILSILLPVLLLWGCAGQSVPEFDGDSAFSFLVEQCDIGPRYPGSSGHRTLQRYLVDQLKNYGANVSLQPFDAVLTTGDTLHLINIIGNYNLDAKKRVLLGAHYDTRPRADRDPDPDKQSAPILGANDGASGVAVLLEIAKICQTSTPPIGVDIVLFDGEDYGLEGIPKDYILGSMYFANHLKGYRPYAVIIIDMIGERGVMIKPEGYSATASRALNDEVFSIAKRLGIDAFSNAAGPYITDDHVPFIQKGVPAIVLIDFDYPHWHTLEDTVDKCSPLSLEAIGAVLVEFLWSQR